MSKNLFLSSEACLNEPDARQKCAAVDELVAHWHAGELDMASGPVAPIGDPGRPEKPRLVAPKHLVRRKLSTAEGHAALIHSICHIEFNAINLALDAVYRFREMPQAYYGDWLKVAREEAYHFGLLRAHLQSLGYDYGDFPAHNGLWEMCIDTAHDPLVRMALVPRVLEARGLDVTPGIMEKLTAIGDDAAVEILHIVQRDEVGHVEIGSRWFHYLCAQRQLDAEQTFKQLLSQYMKGKVRGPLDRDSRLRAGFSETELDYLEGAG